MRIRIRMDQTIIFVIIGCLIREMCCGEVTDFCLTETFAASCPEHQVVLATDARYGRMRDGRCIRRNYGYIGCSQDVLHVLDGLCSGRRECAVRVPDPALEAHRPCPEDLKMYLEASYMCIDVVTASADYCAGAPYVKVMGQTGYLANLVTANTGCGAPNAPWLIEAEAGQQVNLTLIDFRWQPLQAADTDLGDHRQHGICTKYATILEGQSRQDITVCDHGTKTRHLYLSQSSTIEVHILSSPRPREQPPHHYFLIHFQVVGCADLSPPQAAWVQRHGDVATLGCHQTATTWKLVCVDGKWKGAHANCTHDSKSSAMGSQSTLSDISKYLSIPQELALVIVIGTAFLIALIILAIGVICIRRHHDSSDSVPGGGVCDMPGYEYHPACMDGTLQLTELDKSTGGYQTHICTLDRSGRGGGGLCNEYEVIWDPLSQTNTIVPKHCAQASRIQHGEKTGHCPAAVTASLSRAPQCDIDHDTAKYFADMDKDNNPAQDV